MRCEEGPEHTVAVMGGYQVTTIALGNPVRVDAKFKLSAVAR